MKTSRSGVLLTYLFFAFFSAASYAQEGTEELNYPTWFLSERVLTSLKFKLTDNFTVGGWTAGYWGTTFYPSRHTFNPKVFVGYDIVPGFEVGVGKIFGNVKLSLGGDFYSMTRQFRWRKDPDVFHSRARGNIILTMPFAGEMTLQFIQRFEDILQRKVLDGRLAVIPMDHYIRRRSTLKITGPKFTAYKIAPYAYYEGFRSPPANDVYYYEAEFGLNCSPIKNFSMNIADQIQSQPELSGFVAHQINLYLFYTVDLTQKK